VLALEVMKKAIRLWRGALVLSNVKERRIWASGCPKIGSTTIWTSSSARLERAQKYWSLRVPGWRCEYICIGRWAPHWPYSLDLIG